MTLCMTIFVVSGLVLMSSDTLHVSPEHLVSYGAKHSGLILDGELWRFYTPIFLHSNWAHLVFNLVYLFPVCVALESILQRSDFALLLVVIASVSGTFSFLFEPHVSVGASGLVFGVLSAAFGCMSIADCEDILEEYGSVFAMFCIMAIYLDTLGNPQVDHAAHLGGLVAGTPAVLGLCWCAPGVEATSQKA